MKSIVIFALLALAANSFYLNLTALSLGEATTLGLTEQQLQNDAIPCINALSNDIDVAVAAIKSGNVYAILGGIDSWIAQFENDLHVTCQNYTVDAKDIFLAKLNLSQPIELTLEKNLRTYAPEILQQLAALINNVISEQDYEAGVNDATITMILYGLIVPTVPPVPQFNVSLYSKFNQTEFIAGYVPAFLSAIGSNAVVDTNALDVCVNNIETVVRGIEFYKSEAETLSDVEKVETIFGFLTSGANAAESCDYLAELYEQVYGPILHAFENHPVEFILELTNSIASNAPEIVQSIQEEQVYIFEGEYALAGELKAQRFATVFGFLAASP